MRTPSPPIVASAFSGFIVGVLLTLVLTGVLGRGTSSAAPPATVPPTVGLSDGVMQTRIMHLLRAQLGPRYPGQSGPRLEGVQLEPIVGSPFAQPPGGADAAFRTVFVWFNLNDHPLGKSWRVKAAKADVFGILKVLYTSGLPVYDVHLDGDFTPRSGKILRPALVAQMDRSTALRIPWKRWDRVDEERLWRALNYRFLDPRFL